MNIIFDLDGTLVDSKFGVIKALEHAIMKHGGEMPSDTDRLIGPPLRTIIESCLQTDDVILVDQIAQDFKTAYDETFYRITSPYDGIENMLKNLKRPEHRLIIATNKRTIPTKNILHFLKIDFFFDHVFCIDTFNDINSKDKMLERILFTLDITPESSIYIGDRDEDAEAARYANMKFLRVGWGFGENSQGMDSVKSSLDLSQKILAHPSTL
jgi:phosphoglycolate phosphatase